MKPGSSVVAALAVLLCGAAAPAVSPPAGTFAQAQSRTPRRPLKVDRQAMQEAIESHDFDEGSFSSSASYAHFLRSRIAHHQGDHRGAVQALVLALATDDGNPYLLTCLAE